MKISRSIFAWLPCVLSAILTFAVCAGVVWWTYVHQHFFTLHGPVWQVRVLFVLFASELSAGWWYVGWRTGSPDIAPNQPGELSSRSRFWGSVLTLGLVEVWFYNSLQPFWNDADWVAHGKLPVYYQPGMVCFWALLSAAVLVGWWAFVYAYVIHRQPVLLPAIHRE